MLSISSSFFESLHKEQWQEVRLGEVAEIVGGGTPKTSVPEYWGGNIAWLSVADFNNGRKYVSQTQKTITELGLKNSSTKILNQGDIIISARGTVGVVAMLKTPMAFNQTSYGIKSKELVNNHFIYYMLKNASNSLVQNSYGSVFNTITSPILNNYKFLLPPLKVQQQIAEILSSFDDKIDLLHRQNKTLESLALTLFRHTFIDNPNRNEWEEKPLSEIADFLNGLACQKIPPKNEIDRLPVLKIKELREGITESSDWATSEVDSKYIVQNGDIIFSWSASLMVKIWNGQKCILNQHLFKITSAIYPKWFYYFWCLCHLQEFISIASAQATTMGHIKRQDLDNAICLIPDNHTLRELDKVIAPLLLKINNNSQQIQNLQSMRDMLLAKILNEKTEV